MKTNSLLVPEIFPESQTDSP